MPARFLILGSASPELLRQSSESLAGRMELINMGGFNLAEAGVKNQPRHWLRGGFPESFLADQDEDSFSWRKNFIQTFLERDLPQWGISIPSLSICRSVRVKDFVHIRPPSAFGKIGQGLLARFADGPPFLSAGVVGHFLHVSGKVASDVFEIAEEGELSVGELKQKDRVVANMALADFCKNIGPDGGVEAFVFVEFVGFESDDASVACYGL